MENTFDDEQEIDISQLSPAECHDAILDVRTGDIIDVRSSIDAPSSDKVTIFRLRGGKRLLIHYDGTGSVTRLTGEGFRAFRGRDVIRVAPSTDRSPEM